MEFVPYIQSHDLKDLGFKQPCFAEYRQWDGSNPWLQLYQDLSESSTDPADFQYTTECLAPTFSQAFSFFREKHGMSFHISDYYNQESRKLYGRAFQIFINDRQQIFQYSSSSGVELYYTYPEAELACLKKLIEIIKNVNT